MPKTIFVLITVIGLGTLVFAPWTTRPAGAVQGYPCPPDERQIDNLRRNADAARSDARAADIGHTNQAALLATAAEFDQMANDWIRYCLSRPVPTPTPAPTATPAPPVVATAPVARPAPTPVSGVRNNTYTSPTWGYSLEWDGTAWFVNEQGIDLESQIGGFSRGEFLELIPIKGPLMADPGAVVIESYADSGLHPGDAAACLQRYRAFLNESLPVFAAAVNSTGHEISGKTDAGAHYAVFTYTPSDVGDYALYLECRTLVPDEAVLAAMIFAPRAEANEMFADGLKVIDSIRLPERTSLNPLIDPHASDGASADPLLDPHAP